MTQIYAHRGGAGLYPENTLEAIQHSLNIGVDFIDIDVVMNRSHTLVALHDLRLNPDLTQDAKGNFIPKRSPLIKTLTTEELKTFNVGYIKPQSKMAALYPNQQSVEIAKIPTLHEVIELMLPYIKKGITRLQIELKVDAYHLSATYPISQIVKELIKTLKHYDIEEDVEVQCFYWKALQLLKRLAPNIKTSYLHSNAHFSNTNLTLDPIWTLFYYFKGKKHSIPQIIHELGGDIWGPCFSLITPKLVQEAHHLGLKVVPWTVNKVEDMQRLIDCKVDGIITDYPNVMKSLSDK